MRAGQATGENKFTRGPLLSSIDDSVLWTVIVEIRGISEIRYVYYCKICDQQRESNDSHQNSNRQLAAPADNTLSFHHLSDAVQHVASS